MITEEQNAAINSNSKFILVKAGAGTGKTEVLSRRILRLLSDQPDLSINDMAVITFTNKATENLMARLKLYLYHKWKTSTDSELKQRFRYELEGINSAQISTIHNFCQTVLEEAGPIHYPDFNYSPNFSVSESSMRQAVDRTFETWFTERSENNRDIYHERVMPFHHFRKTFVGLYSMLRSQGLSIEQVIKKTKDSILIETGFPRYIKQELVDLLELIIKLHHQLRYHTMDPDNLLEYCYKVLVRDPEIAESIKKKYKYIFVDEFQDTSMYQTGIIKKLCDGSSGSPHLFVVGDSKQSIYQFRGADLASYQSVEKWIKRSGEVLDLSTNFRSTGELVILVNMLFKRIKDAHPEYSFQPEPLKPKEELKVPVYLTDAYEWLIANDEEGITQPDLVANYIKEKLDQGKQPGEFAILFRKNYQMMEFATALANQNIPFQLIGAGNFYNQREIVDTYKVLNFISDPTSSINAEEALETIYFAHDKESMHTVTDELISNLEIRTPAQLLDKLYQVTKIRERLVRDNPRAAANLNKLKDLSRSISIKENMQLNEYISWLHAMIASHKEEQQSDIPVGDETNAVTLITIHKAKGLEYPIVILPHLDEATSQTVLAPPILYSQDTGLEYSYKPYYGEKNAPRIQSNEYSNIIKDYQNELHSEELRVLYVALTRAEKKLVLVGDEHCPKKSVCFQNWLKLI
ncbi:UvrD-helicase domain-containing protein [Paenibacillus sp. NRS-1760]|uniref:UvrD-helicase domain-containing protein n=1 Tax=Paenibacillus sp. NRS-1760 TaxID=3233902 RepID=UPI003D2D1E3A